MKTASWKKKPQIMIVEDELIVAENLAQNLRKLGYPVTAIIDSGEEAIQTAIAVHPDIILMDIMLPGNIDGIDAAEAIYHQLEIPVVYMTAYADHNTLERAKQTEPYGYLIKPFKPEDIRTTIEIAFKRYQVEQTIAFRYKTQLQYLQDQLEEFTKNSSNSVDSAQTSAEFQAIASDLELAIKHRDFQLYYQPQIDLRTGQIIGAEALLRWFHLERGFISPATFIPIAEETGLIVQIDEWVFQTACQQMLDLHQAGLDQLKISINLSAQQFKTKNLAQRLFQITRDIGLNPELINIELTESTLVHDIDLGIHHLQTIQALGIKIAVDDFGTGYSSLSYLKDFSFDILKIDRSFIQDIDQNLKQQAIVQSMISMAHQLNLTVIAEGIETEAELQFLQQNGCDAAQGYLISKPLPWQQFQQFCHCGIHPIGEKKFSLSSLSDPSICP